MWRGTTILFEVTTLPVFDFVACYAKQSTNGHLFVKEDEDQKCRTTISNTGIRPSDSLTHSDPALCRNDAKAMHVMPEFQRLLQIDIYSARCDC